MRGHLAGLAPKPGSYSREVAGSLATDVAIVVLTTISTILLANLLGPTGRGELASARVYPLIVGLFGTLGLFEAVIYFGGREPDRVGRYATSAAAGIVLAGVPIVLVAALAMPWLLHAQSPEVVRSAQLYLGLLFVHAVHGVPVHVARALHRIDLWNRLRLAAPLLWLGIAVGSSLTGADDPHAILRLHLASLAVLSLLLWLAVRPQLRGAWRPEPRRWRPMLRYGVPVALGTGPHFLGERLDQLFLAGLLPARELGIYTVAVAWSALALLPAVAMRSVAFSRIVRIQEREDKLAFIRRGTLAAAGVGAATTLVLAAAAEVVIPLVFDARFAPAIALSRVLLLGALVRGVADLLQVGLQAMGRPTAVMGSEWLGLAALALGAFALVPLHGATGAAAAVVLARLVALGATVGLAHRALPGLIGRP